MVVAIELFDKMPQRRNMFGTSGQFQQPKE